MKLAIMSLHAMWMASFLAVVSGGDILETVMMPDVRAELKVNQDAGSYCDSGSGVRFIDNFLSNDEIQLFIHIKADIPTAWGRTHGLASIPPAILKRLIDVGAAQNITQGSSAKIKTTVFEETTPVHFDHYTELEINGRAQDDVGFVFLNDNPSAHFVYGDDLVPAVAGRLLLFRGGQVKHNTIIEDGAVHLLGPFETGTLTVVGIGGGCSQGFFLPPQTGQCEECPAGTFSPGDTGSGSPSSCTTCPADTFSSSGAGSCTSCPMGTSPAGSDSEDDCTLDAGGGSDPHFKTWSGKRFDYQGQCDMVFLKTPHFANGLGLAIHIRTTIRRHYSFIEAAAIRIGDAVLEITDRSKYYINGVEGTANETTTMFAGYPLVHEVLDGKTNKFKLIVGENDLAIDIHVWDIFMGVFVHRGTSESDVNALFHGSLGMMGDFSTGNLTSRDGLATFDDPSLFALDWQVGSDGTDPFLFQTARAPQYPDVCLEPEPVVGQGLIDPALQFAAEVACAHWGDGKAECIYDVLATGNIDIAAGEVY